MEKERQLTNYKVFLGRPRPRLPELFPLVGTILPLGLPLPRDGVARAGIWSSPSESLSLRLMVLSTRLLTLVKPEACGMIGAGAGVVRFD